MSGGGAAAGAVGKERRRAPRPGPRPPAALGSGSVDARDPASSGVGRPSGARDSRSPWVEPDPRGARTRKRGKEDLGPNRRQNVAQASGTPDSPPTPPCPIARLSSKRGQEDARKRTGRRPPNVGDGGGGTPTWVWRLGALITRRSSILRRLHVGGGRRGVSGVTHYVWKEVGVEEEGRLVRDDF